MMIIKYCFRKKKRFILLHLFVQINLHSMINTKFNLNILFIHFYKITFVLQSNQVKRFAQESRFGFVVQNLNPFFVRTSQIEIEKRTSRVKPRFE